MSSSSVVSSLSLSSLNLSPFDVTILVLSSVHLLFSLLSSFFLLHFHLLHLQKTKTTTSRIAQLNSLWPVRLLLLLFSSLLSLSELLRLPISHSCLLYSLTSRSLSQPAFFSTLLFLLRSSTNSSSHYSSSFLISISLAIPFLLLHSLLLIFPPPYPLLRIPSLPDRCPHPLLSTMLLALLALLYVPLFVSASSRAVSLVINRMLRFRLYALVASVVVALALQVTALALSSLWEAGSRVAQGLGLVAYVAVVGCAVVGEVILVVMPVVDARAIVEMSSGMLLGGGKEETRV